MMFPHFFERKMKEVRAFLKITKGKFTSNDQLRVEGVKDALKAMKEEKRVYLKEREEAKRGIDTDLHRYSARGGESGENRDISAI